MVWLRILLLFVFGELFMVFIEVKLSMLFVDRLLVIVDLLRSSSCFLFICRKLIWFMIFVMMMLMLLRMFVVWLLFVNLLWKVLWMMRVVVKELRIGFLKLFLVL